MQIEFTKMEGLGNDFIFLDDRNQEIGSHLSYPALAEKLCDRRLGVGADGIILILDSDSCDLKFRIFNSDGSEAQMCGNGMRCFAKLAYTRQLIAKESFTVETLSGTIIPRLLFTDQGQIDSVTVDMGPPILAPPKIPFVSENVQAVSETIQVAGKDIPITAVSMGNPHAVLFVDSADDAPVTELGPLIENHERFPEKTNVEFVEVISETELKMKVWERGAGVTMACGTGACAALVAAVLNQQTSRRARIQLDGGNLLVQWDEQTNHILKTGPANLVFTGCIDIVR